MNQRQPSPEVAVFAYKNQTPNTLITPPIFKWKSFKLNTKLPSKRPSDSGFDIYTVENNVWLKPHETRLFSTGLACAIPECHWLRAVDRGSTGSKGIHVHCGIIDEEYVGEIFIALNNTNNYPILFTDVVEKVCFKRTWYGRKYMCYPVSKAIAQLIPEHRVVCESQWATDQEWTTAATNSVRGEGKLGASGK